MATVEEGKAQVAALADKVENRVLVKDDDMNRMQY